MKNTTKAILIAVCFMLTATTLMSTVMAGDFVVLREKDPNTWLVVPGGNWGLFTVTNLNRMTFFSFRGVQVVPNADYCLISFKESYPGIGSVRIANGTSSSTGTLFIRGILPTLVWNTYTTGDYAGQTGAKIWLVLKNDVDYATGEFVLWHPGLYLFQTKLILV